MTLKTAIAIVACLLAASAGKAQTQSRTPEARAMLNTIKAMPAEGRFMFGHHDDTMYGVGWVGGEGRSDVKSVCGDYPAVMSFDLGDIELGHDVNLDSVPFDMIRREAVAQYERGGMVTMSWHANNPLTGNNAWDVADSTVVRSVLPGGANHDKFVGWLDRVAGFLNSIRTSDGTKVPVLFRPWHEHTGSWFWWGQALCSTDEYKALWQLTYDRLTAKGADQLLWAYSPGTEPKDSADYLERYPGDGKIDLVGADVYQYGSKADYMASLDRILGIVNQVSRAHGKAMALTEAGYESIPDSTWWTQTLLPVVSRYPVSYVLVWRNAHNKPGHYFAPYPGEPSAKDFVRFYDDCRTVFVKDMSCGVKQCGKCNYKRNNN